jgi:WD40 repeat protein
VLVADIYNTRTWKIVKTIPVRRNVGMAFSPDGKYFTYVENLTTGHATATIRETASWRKIRHLKPVNANSFCYSPDGTRLAMATSTGIDFWNCRLFDR